MTPGSRVPVRQLLYTNVEAPQSPTNQRGFQVWRCSPRLDLAVRKAVEDRVKDFRLPAYTRPETMGIVRHTGFPISGGYVVARTVPLAKLDKFGRDGRFFAHAVIFETADFRRVGCDPFAVFDRFNFLTSPDDPPGQRPAKEFEGEESFDLNTPAAPTGDPDPPRVWFEAMLAHVTGPNPLPILIAAPPGEVLAIARAVIRALPPARRAQFDFDTLSSGLFGVGSHLLGGYSTDAIRTWPSRKYVLYDPKTGAAKPELPPRARDLPFELLTASGWEQLTDDERDAAYHVAGELGAKRPADLGKYGPLTEGSGSVLESAGALDAVKPLAKEKAAAEVPEAFHTFAAVASAVSRYFGPPLQQAVERLLCDIPAAVVADGLVGDLCRTGASRPEQVDLNDLYKWVDSHDVQENDLGWKLKCVVARWRGRANDLRTLQDLLTAPNPSARREWLRGWVQSTLAPGVRDADPAALERLLPVARPPDPSNLREVLLRLAAGEPNDDPVWGGVRLRAAYHDAPASVIAQLDAVRRTDGGVQLVAAVVSELVVASGIPSWLVRDNRLLFGLFCPHQEAQAARAAFLNAAGHGDSTGAVTAFRAKNNLVKNPIEPPIAAQPTRDNLVGGLTAALLKKEAQLSFLDNLRNGLGKELKGNPKDDDFQWAARRLGEVVSAVPCFSHQSHGWFVGLHISARDVSRLGYRHLFEALAGSVAPDAFGGAPDLTTGYHENRYWWLYDLLAATRTN